jgi:hypothetical protein
VNAGEKVFRIEPVCSWRQGDTVWSLALLDVVLALLNRNTSASRQWVVALAQQTWDIICLHFDTYNETYCIMNWLNLKKNRRKKYMNNIVFINYTNSNTLAIFAKVTPAEFGLIFKVCQISNHAIWMYLLQIL